MTAAKIAACVVCGNTSAAELFQIDPHDSRMVCDDWRACDARKAARNPARILGALVKDATAAADLDAGFDLDVDRWARVCDEPVEFTESPAGDRGRERWARSYYERDGAPENEADR